MKRYEDYKQTGTPWIGDVPSHWIPYRIKYNTFLKGRIGWQGLKADEFKDEGYCLITGTDFDNNGGINWETCYRISEERFLEDTLLHVKNGDILLTKDGTIGKLAYIDNLPEPASLNSHLLIVRQKNNLILNSFLYFVLSSSVFKDFYSYNQTGSIMNSISQEMFSYFNTFVPSVEEQERIVEYLHAKCGAIDKVIATQERRIALLEELKQSVITEAVTRGINPDAKLRPSGIDWIGNIPSHWGYKRLRFVCEFRNGYTPSKANPDFWTDGTIPWYRMEDIRDSGRRLNEAKQYVTEEAVKGAGLFEAGSFIVATTATIGEHAVLIVDSLANQQFTNFQIRKSLSKEVDNEFFFYFLFVVDDYCKSTTKTATFAAVNIDDLKNFPVTIPPLSEQIQIIRHIKRKTASIDASIAKARREIELLKELKQSVITEAVTGKIKVC